MPDLFYHTLPCRHFIEELFKHFLWLANSTFPAFAQHKPSDPHHDSKNKKPTDAALQVSPQRRS